ncbi:MAG: response regulator transcription factor [Clostridia bacterium]|nr:response regulator transcription factor [Clostridia bacterium]
MSVNNVIVIVDDDKNICELVRLYLTKEGYDVKCAFDGNSALRLIEEAKPAAAILDIMLPGIDGIEVLKEIRRSSRMPVIMLTAKGETIDKVLGLELGADDYVVKPFEPKELVARLRAVLRRSDDSNSLCEEVCFDKLSINMSTYELKLDGEIVDIPPKELELLSYLCNHPNKVFTRDQLLNQVWGYEYFGDSRTVDVHVKRLREKIEGLSDKWSLKTVWGVGYKFEVK